MVFLLQKVQAEVLKEYKKMKQVSVSVHIFDWLIVCQLWARRSVVTQYVCICYSTAPTITETRSAVSTCTTSWLTSRGSLQISTSIARTPGAELCLQNRPGQVRPGWSSGWLLFIDPRHHGLRSSLLSLSSPFPQSPSFVFL